MAESKNDQFFLHIQIEQNNYKKQQWSVFPFKTIKLQERERVFLGQSPKSGASLAFIKSVFLFPIFSHSLIFSILFFFFLSLSLRILICKKERKNLWRVKMELGSAHHHSRSSLSSISSTHSVDFESELSLSDKLKVFKSSQFDPDNFLTTKCRAMSEKVFFFFFPLFSILLLFSIIYCYIGFVILA